MPSMSGKDSSMSIAQWCRPLCSSRSESRPFEWQDTEISYFSRACWMIPAVPGSASTMMTDMPDMFGEDGFF